MELSVLAVEEHRLVPVHFHGHSAAQFVALEIGDRLHLHGPDAGDPYLVGCLVDIHLGPDNQFAIQPQLGQITCHSQQVAIGRASELQGITPDVEPLVLRPIRFAAHLHGTFAA